MKEICLYTLLFFFVNNHLYAQDEKFNVDVLFFSNTQELQIKIQNLSKESTMDIVLDSIKDYYKYSNQNIPAKIAAKIKVFPQKQYQKKYKFVNEISTKLHLFFKYTFDNAEKVGHTYWRTFSKEITFNPYIKERIQFHIDDTVFEEVKKEAEFPGGFKMLRQYLFNEIHKKCGNELYHENEVIRIKVIVERNGDLSHPCVIGDYNALGKRNFFKETALNIIKDMPKWKPALKNGEKVRSYQIITFVFRQDP